MTIFPTEDSIEPSPKKAEPMTANKVDFGFRIYWTKMTLRWDKARRAAVRQQVEQLTQATDFQHNLLEKRYNLELEDIPEKTHSGASLVALLEVLAALDTMEQESE